MVNKRPLTAVSSDPRVDTVLTPASLLTSELDPYTAVGRSHIKDELRRDYMFNFALADRFWHDWIDFCPNSNIFVPVTNPNSRSASFWKF